MDLPHSPSILDNRLEHVFLQGFSSDVDIRQILKHFPQAKHLTLFHVDLSRITCKASLDIGNIHLNSFVLDIGPSLNCSKSNQIITVRVGEQIIVVRAQRNKPNSEPVSVSWLTNYKNFRILSHELVNRYHKPKLSKGMGSMFIDIHCSGIDEIKLCLNDTFAHAKLNSSY